MEIILTKYFLSKLLGRYINETDTRNNQKEVHLNFNYGSGNWKLCLFLLKREPNRNTRFSAGTERFERPSAVLETAILPLNYVPKLTPAPHPFVLCKSLRLRDLLMLNYRE